MKKFFKINGLCCANCASKIEVAVNKLDAVETATLSFMTSRLTVETNGENLPIIIEEIKKIINKYEPNATIGD